MVADVFGNDTRLYSKAVHFAGYIVRDESAGGCVKFLHLRR